MCLFLSSIFVLELALLFVHEMDAVHRQEWKMFMVLKDMQDEAAYWTFALLHIPLYAAIFFLLFSPYVQVGFYVTDAFLIAHMFVHFMFKRHPANRLNGTISKMLIYLIGLLALIHLILQSIC